MQHNQDQIKQLNIPTFENIPLSDFDDSLSEEYDKQQDELAKENKVRISGIPEEYQKGFGDYKTDTVERQALLNVVQRCFKAWIDGKPVTVCLLGDNGIGKTKLACAFLMETLNFTKNVYGIPCHYSIRYVLLDDIRVEYERAKSFTSTKNQNQVIAEWTDIDVLVIDEIGIGENLEVQKTLFYKLMNERDLKKKTTILVSNYEFQEFAQFSGRATMDRLKNTAVFPSTKGIKSFRGNR